MPSCCTLVNRRSPLRIGEHLFVYVDINVALQQSWSYFAGPISPADGLRRANHVGVRDHPERDRLLGRPSIECVQDVATPVVPVVHRGFRPTLAVFIDVVGCLTEAELYRGVALVSARQRVRAQHFGHPYFSLGAALCGRLCRHIQDGKLAEFLGGCNCAVC